MTDKTIAALPFSRPFLVDECREDGITLTISADAHERAALAADFGIPAIAALTAEFTLERAGRGRIHVSGRMDATVTQICVVSLDPFETEVNETVDVTFAPPDEVRAAEVRAAADQELQGAGAIEEPPDPIIDGRIDLGALAAEFLALGLDPYPRKPGVDFAAPIEADAPDSPFAVLGRLEGRDRSRDR